MGDIVVDERVKEQYKNPDKLNVRANLHSYNIEKLIGTDGVLKG